MCLFLLEKSYFGAICTWILLFYFYVIYKKLFFSSYRDKVQVIYIRKERGGDSLKRVYAF